MIEKVTIGEATLYLGNCVEVMCTLDMVDAVITDPPYLEGDKSEILWGLMAIAAGRVVLTPGKLESFNWIMRRKPLWEYCWRNSSNSVGGSSCLHIGWEPVLAYGFPLRPLGNDVLDYPIVGSKPPKGHPWPKPIKLIKKLVSHWSNAGDTVLDPYMGSGTTGMACAQMGRKFIGIEIEPKYFELSCRQIEAAYAQPDILITPPAKQEAMQLV